MWKAMHATALGYPEHAEEVTPEHRDAYKTFYTTIDRVLPCPECARNFNRTLESIPSIDGYLTCRADLFKWTVALHNAVNVELGKHEHLSPEEAMKRLMPRVPVPKPGKCKSCT